MGLKVTWCWLVTGVNLVDSLLLFFCCLSYTIENLLG